MGFGPVRGRIPSEEPAKGWGAGERNDGGGGEPLVSFPFLSLFFFSLFLIGTAKGWRVMLGVGWGLGSKARGTRGRQDPPAGPQSPQQLEEGSVSAKPPPHLCYKGLILLPFLVYPSQLRADTPASPMPRRVTSSPPGNPPVLGWREQDQTQPKEPQG